MRNPLHYSSELLVKKAAPQPALYIPTYTPQVPQNQMSDEQIAAVMQNIQSYPEEQQQQILDSINQNFGQAQYRGGLAGGFFGGLGNYLKSFGNTLQQGANWASQGLFGGKPFDVQDSDRYRAQTVLQTAAQNPELYAKVMRGLQSANVIPQVPAATTTAPAAAPAPTPAPTPQPTPASNFSVSDWISNPLKEKGYFDVTPGQPVFNYAGAYRGTLHAAERDKSLLKALPPQYAANTAQYKMWHDVLQRDDPWGLKKTTAPTPTPTVTPSTPTPPSNNYKIPSVPSLRPKGIPSADAFIQANKLQPRKEGLIDGIPASEWSAKNRARQQNAAKAYAKNNTGAAPANQGLEYNPTTGQYQQPGYNMYAGRVLSSPAPTAKPTSAPASTPTPQESTYDPNYKPNLKGIRTYKPTREQLIRGMGGTP